MRPLPLVLLTACCISLFSPQLQALRAEEHRLDIINLFFDISDDALPSTLLSPDSGPLSIAASLLQPRSLAVGSRRPIPASLSWAYPSSEPNHNQKIPQVLLPPLLRPRRHLSSRGTQHHHTQLMRVGCKLGTCQVQNLSHRLYQLIGQRGREDSSPINPKSPHSYG